MRSYGQRGVVLQLVMIGDSFLVSNRIAAAGKGALHQDFGTIVICGQIVVTALVLKAGFVYRPRAQYLRVTELKRMFCAGAIVALRGQTKEADSIAGLIDVCELVAGGQRVVGAQLVIDAAIHAGPRARIWYRLGHAYREQVSIQRGGDNRCGVINIAMLHVKEIGRMLVQWPADV